MELMDDILEFLHYHPFSKRVDVEKGLAVDVSSATVKRTLARGLADGMIAASEATERGQPLATEWDRP